jgi:hypothetical protein
MKTKLKSGKTFRSIAAMSLASACLMFASCEKEASVLNPEQGVNGASSNPSSALVTEFDAKMQEQLSLLPLGDKLVEIAQDEIETSLNTVFSKMEGDFSEVKTSSFTSQVPVNNGRVSFLNEQAWLLESATQITNLVLQNVNDQIFGIDVVVETLNNPTVVQIKTSVYSVSKTLDQTIEKSEYCKFTSDATYQEAATFMQRYTNFCLMPALPIGARVIKTSRFEYTIDNIKDLKYYETQDDLFYIEHPSNNGRFMTAPSGDAIGLEATRWEEYRVNLKSFYNARILELGPTMPGEHWEVVAHLVVDPFTKALPQYQQGMAHHHHYIGTYILITDGVN